MALASEPAPAFDGQPGVDDLRSVREGSGQVRRVRERHPEGRPGPGLRRRSRNKDSRSNGAWGRKRLVGKLNRLALRLVF